MIPIDSNRSGINRWISLSLNENTVDGFFILLIRLVLSDLGFFDLTSELMSEADESRLLFI